MAVENDFYFEGVRRASWIFGSPNEFGAFLASAIPLVWILWHFVPSGWSKSPKKLLIASVLILVELGLFVALVRTVSRGALVAILGALAIGLLTRAKFFGLKSAVTEFGLRAALVCLLVSLSSLGSRVSVDYVADDASVGNRSLLWRGGAIMIAARPVAGWGAGEGGAQFVQWIQPIDRNERYKAMVNSFLDVGVERGGFALFLAVFLAILFSFSGLICNPAKQRLAMIAASGSASWTAFWIANVFSSLIDDWRLWILPLLGVLILVACLCMAKVSVSRTLSLTKICAGGSAVVCGLILLFGFVAQTKLPLKITSEENGMVSVEPRTPSPALEIYVIPDESILGDVYGHEIRRMVGGVARRQILAHTIDPRFARDALPTVPEGSYLLLFGANAHMADLSDKRLKVILCSPTGDRPASLDSLSGLVINAIDETGEKDGWIEFGLQKGAIVQEVPEIGLSALAAWPDRYLEAILTCIGAKAE